jgi:hypothetical protein
LEESKTSETDEGTSIEEEEEEEEEIEEEVMPECWQTKEANLKLLSSENEVQ